MIVNQKGEPIREDALFFAEDFQDEGEISEVLLLLLDRLNLVAVRTNATKHGHVELVLKDKDEYYK